MFADGIGKPFQNTHHFFPFGSCGFLNIVIQRNDRHRFHKIGRARTGLPVHNAGYFGYGIFPYRQHQTSITQSNIFFLDMFGAFAHNAFEADMNFIIQTVEFFTNQL